MDRITAMRAFVRLVELGSFSAVAQELRIKQSTVSKWLAALEDELGVQLVQRTTRRQRLTEEGELFHERASSILALYDGTTEELALGSVTPRGRIRLSVPVVFGRLFVTPLVAKFMRRFPGIEVELVFSDRYVNLVEDGFHASLRVGRPVDSSLRCIQLGTAQRLLVASPAYLKGAPALASPRDLAKHSCLLHTSLGAGDVWTFERDGKKTRASVRGRFAANNSEAILSMVRAGLGIGLLASWLVEKDLGRSRIVRVLADFEAPRAATQLLLPPGRFVAPHVRAFSDFLREQLVVSKG